MWPVLLGIILIIVAGAIIVMLLRSTEIVWPGTGERHVDEESSRQIKEESLLRQIKK